MTSNDKMHHYPQIVHSENQKEINNYFLFASSSLMCVSAAFLSCVLVTENAFSFELLIGKQGI